MEETSCDSGYFHHHDHHDYHDYHDYHDRCCLVLVNCVPEKIEKIENTRTIVTTMVKIETLVFVNTAMAVVMFGD